MNGLHERLAALTPQQRRLLALRRGGAAPARGGRFSLVAEEDRHRLPAGLEDAYPVSQLQLGMLYHLDLEAGAATRAYHNVNRWHLRAPFDGALLRRAIRDEVPRHEFLRTGFDLARYREPLQLLWPTVEVPVPVEDLRALPPRRRRERVDAAVRAESRRPFDLARPPLWRFRLLRDGEDTFHFLLTELHAVADGWSLNATLADVLRRYFALLDGDEPAAAPLPAFRYRDFVELEAAARRSPECRRFWEQRVADLPAVELPPRTPGAAPYPPRKLHLALPAELMRRLEDRVARGAGAPLKSVLLAAHLVVLSQLAADREVVTGLVSNGRPERGDGDRVRGLFLNTLPLRLEMGGAAGAGESWLGLVRRALSAEVEMLPHRRYPLADLRRRAGDPPPFETSFAYVRFHSLAAVARRVAFDAGGFSAVSVTNYPLAAVFQSAPAGDAAKLTLVFDDRRLDRTQVQALLLRYRRVLEAMAQRPEAPHAVADLLLPAELHRLLHEWNDTDSPWPGPSRLHELVAREARRRPDAVALELADRTLSYGALAARWRVAAGRLRAAGVGPGDRVGLLATRSLETVVALLAVLEAGAAFVPLDPDHPSERLRLQVGEADLAALAGSAAALARLAGGEGGPRHLPLEALCAGPPAGATEPRAADAAGAGPAAGEAPAYVLFTSGTTGRPKAVSVPHRAIRNRLLWMVRRLPFGPGDRVLHKTPLTFDASLWELFVPLLAGGRVVLARPDGHRDTAYLAGLVAQRDVEVLQLVPSQLRVFLAEAALDRARALRLLFCGGEALPAELQRRALERLPAIRLHNLYGPTEAAIDVASRRCRPRGEDPRVLLGRPLPNCRLRVLGPRLELRPAGGVGEICAGGVHLAHGYHGRARQTAERFVPDPFAARPGERLYRTGDLGRLLADGTLEFLGRADGQVKIRGVRVEPAEVEAALASHPRVRAVAVAGRGDGGGELRLVAYVVAPDPRPSAAELKVHARRHLPAALVPAHVVFLDRLPRTSGGKLDRRALPAPAPATPAPATAAAPPTGPVEELLAELWAVLLGRDGVGAEEDVFELGAHSLTATRLVSQVRGALGVELPLREVFAAPTVRALARRVERARTAAAGSSAGAAPPPPLEPARGDGPLPLSFAQERLWFLDQLAPGNAVYNVPFGLRLGGALRVAALEQALGQVVRRHRVLRSRFPQRDGVPHQEVLPAPPARLPLADLRRLAPEHRGGERDRLAGEAFGRPFDLARGPLLRAALLRAGSEEHALVLVLHHVVSDAWSTGVLAGETSAAYRDLAAGRPPGLPELPVQYGDFALWQRRWLDGPVLDAELAFWRRRLAGAPRLELPGAGDDGRDTRGAHHRFRLPAELAAGLRGLGRQERTTPFMTLLAALQVLLAREAGQSDVVVGTDVANRTRAATERLVGFFINLLALRTDLSGDPTFREVLGRVREVTLEAYAHQELPFARVVEELRPERRTRLSPLFDVLFVYQNTPREPLRLPGLEVAPLPAAAPHSRFDLGLFVEPDGDGLRGRWTFRTARFAPAFVAGLAERYQALLAEVVAHPERRLAELAAAAAPEVRAERHDRRRDAFSRFVGGPAAVAADEERA